MHAWHRLSNVSVEVGARRGCFVTGFGGLFSAEATERMILFLGRPMESWAYEPIQLGLCEPTEILAFSRL